jgi:hypothetical protein
MRQGVGTEGLGIASSVGLQELGALLKNVDSLFVAPL